LKRFINVFPTLVLCAWISAAAHGQSLEEELAGLSQSHPQVNAARKGVASTREEAAKAVAAFLPTVNLASDIGPEYIDSPAERASGDAEPWSRTRSTTTLTVTQNLFRGFSDESASRSAQINRLVSQSTLDITRQNIMMEGVAAYIDVRRQLRLVELARQNEETIQIQLNLEDERVQKGSGIAVDVLQAKSRLQLAKERRTRFEGNLENALARYTQVFGHTPDLERMYDPLPSGNLLPDTLEAAISIAVSENPSILNSDYQVEAARELRRAARSEFMPRIDIVGSLNYEKNNDGTLGVRRDASVLLQANWDLFSGFTARANVAQAAFDYSASRDNYDYTVRKTVEQVRLTWQALLTARARVELLENAVNIASEVYESRRALRAAGQETVINVLDAESEIANAQINFASATFDERAAVYQLLLAMGRLEVSTLAVNNEESNSALFR